MSPRTYVHRIGRTGRASASGIALSFLYGRRASLLKKILRKLIKQQVPRIGEHPFMEGADVVDRSLTTKPQGRSNNRNRPRNKKPKQ